MAAKAVATHDDDIKWKHFPGIHRSPVNSPHESKRPVTRNFDGFFYLSPDLRLVIWNAIAPIMTSS